MMHFPMFDAYFMSPPGPTWALRGKANFRSESGSTVDADASTVPPSAAMICA